MKHIQPIIGHISAVRRSHTVHRGIQHTSHILNHTPYKVRVGAIFKSNNYLRHMLLLF